MFKKTKHHIFNKSNCIFYIIFFLITVSFFLINYLSPYIADDYNYLEHRAWNSNEIIDSLPSLLMSGKEFYLDWGGRVVPYILIMLLAFLPKAGFAILNTLAYLSAMYLIYRISTINTTKKLFLLFLTHIIIWYTVPDYGQIMFWLCGSANYLWTSLPVLLMLYVFRYYYSKKGECFNCWIWIPVLCILGFLSGMAMENMSAGLLVILTLYLFLCFKQSVKLKPSIISAYVFSLLGTAFLIFAPGNALRNSSGENAPKSILFTAINYYWITFIGILCVSWIVLYMLLRKTNKNFTIESAIFMTGAFASAYCMIAAPTSPERTWYIVCALALVANIILLSTLLQNHISERQILHSASHSCAQPAEETQAHYKKIIFIAVIGISIIFFTSVADTLYRTYELHTQASEREEIILSQKAQGIMDIAVPIYHQKYPLRSNHDALAGLSDIKTDPGYWINASTAKYYGVNSITGIATDNTQS